MKAKEKSFLEILTEKIEKEVKRTYFSSEKPAFPSENLSQNAKIGTFSLERMSISPIFPRKKDILKKVYPSAPRPSPVEKRIKHQLSEEQNQAWNYFFRWKTGLALDFTEKELKTIFRQLAHKLHPDRQGGSALYYMELKKNYETLHRVFETKAA